MPNYPTRDEVERMNLADAQTELRNLIYEATGFVETLQRLGKISGNGHHARQEMANDAARLLEIRWLFKEEPGKP